MYFKKNCCVINISREKNTLRKNILTKFVIIQAWSLNNYLSAVFAPVFVECFNSLGCFQHGKVATGWVNKARITTFVHPKGAKRVSHVHLWPAAGVYCPVCVTPVHRFHCASQNTRAEIGKDDEGADGTPVVCQRCFFHRRRPSHHQCIGWRHREGTWRERAPCVSVASAAPVLKRVCVVFFMSHCRFGIRNPGSACTLTSLCREHRRCPSTTWFPSRKIQNSFWFATTPARWSSWTCTARWEDVIQYLFCITKVISSSSYMMIANSATFLADKAKKKR